MGRILMAPNYWKWERIIPKDVCELIKKEFAEDQKVDGQVQSKEGGTVDPKMRKSNLCWLGPNHWVEGILFNHVIYANIYAGWQYEILNIEQIQLTRYKTNQFYEWHKDAPVISDNQFTRKLSVVLLLSDPSEYEGGGLFIKDVDEEQNVLQNQGDLIVFPSFLLHKAETVTSGTRMTAVGWVNGPRFK